VGGGGQTCDMTPSARTHKGRASDDVSVTLPDDPTAPGKAREMVRGTLAGWDLAALIDDAVLAVSELATNALKHGLPPVVLRIRQRRESVRMDVTDTRPSTASRDLVVVSLDADESGRGRGIIEAVSDHSGTEQTTDDSAGKSSYASWDLDPDTAAVQHPPDKRPKAPRGVKGP
jgi:anti-sigma regulatory factor (Ser/Thr protein kinase)